MYTFSSNQYLLFGGGKTYIFTKAITIAVPPVTKNGRLNPPTFLKELLSV